MQQLGGMGGGMAAGPPVGAGPSGTLTPQQVKDAFREFDLDKNGYVGAAEISHILQSIGEKVTDDEVDEMILMADQDGDGQVSFEEFARLVQTFAASIPQYAPPAGMPQGMGGGYGGIGGGAPGMGGGVRGGMGMGMGAGAGAGIGMDGKAMMDGKGMGMPPMGPGVVGAATGPASGNPMEDMEAFQRMYGLDADALKKIYSKFKTVDADGSGQVDINEFCRVLRVERSQYVERLFSLFDSDRSGSIDLKEFIVGLCNVGSTARDDKVKFAFEIFDLDASGYINKDELRKIVKATNMATEKQLDRKVKWLMTQCDKDGDGRISYEEFVQLSKKFPNIVFPAFSLASSLGGGIKGGFS